EYKVRIVGREIFKLFMDQISSLKYWDFWDGSHINSLTIYPRATNCLRNLSELECDSTINHILIRQLFQIVHNLQSLSIRVDNNAIFSEFIDLISVQRNLKYLRIGV